MVGCIEVVAGVGGNRKVNGRVYQVAVCTSTVCMFMYVCKSSYRRSGGEVEKMALVELQMEMLTYVGWEECLQ